VGDRNFTAIVIVSDIRGVIAKTDCYYGPISIIRNGMHVYIGISDIKRHFPNNILEETHEGRT
jgi:hypothetical protein